MSPTSAPLVITQSEFMRRMKEQQAVGGGGFQMFGDMPDSYEVTVNANHPLAITLLNETDEAKQRPGQAGGQPRPPVARPARRRRVDGVHPRRLRPTGTSLMGYAKWIGGAVGWALGVQSAASWATGSGRCSQTTAWPWTARAPSVAITAEVVGRNQARPTRAGDFALSMVVLSAAVMQADERVLKSELDYVKQFFRTNFWTGPG